MQNDTSRYRAHFSKVFLQSDGNDGIAEEQHDAVEEHAFGRHTTEPAMSEPVEDDEGHGGHEARKEEEEEREAGDPGVAFVDQRLGVDDGRQVVPDAEKDPVDDQLCPPDANPFPALWRKFQLLKISRIVRGTNRYSGFAQEDRFQLGLESADDQVRLNFIKEIKLVALSHVKLLYL